jgi:Leucine-rich repeat (LRR) protein
MENNNKIYKSIEVNNMSHIKILDISNNNLFRFPSEEINLLNNLMILNCSNNNITEINLTNPKLIVFECYNNKLNKFPNIVSSTCINISKNNIMDIPYKKILQMNLIVFFYHDNIIPINKQLLVFEFKRQEYLIQTLQFEYPYEIQKIMKNSDDNKISIKMLKDFEEDVYENYYTRELIEQILYF